MANNLRKKNVVFQQVGPCRQWICSTAPSLGLTLGSVFTIDPDRYFCSSADLLFRFYKTYENLITSSPPQLILVGDEEMIDSNFKNKVIALTKHRTLLKLNIEVPHITSMCCHSVIGKTVPIYIILSNSIQSLPKELIEFKDGALIQCLFSHSGWMAKDFFQFGLLILLTFQMNIKKAQIKV